jgi:hypothetical protein
VVPPVVAPPVVVPAVPPDVVPAVVPAMVPPVLLPLLHATAIPHIASPTKSHADLLMAAHLPLIHSPGEVGQSMVFRRAARGAASFAPRL